MVEGLLDLERLALRERGTGVQTVDLREILSRRAELARAAATHGIDVECPVELPVQGDPSLLERLIENLVGNAMKFSPRGSTVTLRGLRRGEELVLEGEDQGPGIAPDDRDRVMRRFGRGQNAGDQPGLGLGLAFVAEIARWHGGSVEVDEGLEGGACLRATLPASTRAAAKESNG